MIPEQIDAFFFELDKEMGENFSVLITGAAAGAIAGSVKRPTDDIDFEVDLPSHLSDKFTQAINAVSKRLDIAAQYSENIAGWSQISLLNYRETALPYKTIGSIEIRLMALENWTLGKIARYYPLDKKDVTHALKHGNIAAEPILAFWAKALKASPLSDRSREFRDHVFDYLNSEGKQAWGKGFDAPAARALFENLLKK